MKIDISLQSDFLDDTPNNSAYLHLAIITGALKYCLGQSKSMSFSKLAYIFDKAINKEAGAFKSKITLSPWIISSDFKKSLLIAEAHNYIELNPSPSNEIKINNSQDGDEYIAKIENLNIFEDYIEYLKKSKITEARFVRPVIRSELNEN
jgi:hypothetical protein